MTDPTPPRPLLDAATIHKAAKDAGLQVIAVGFYVLWSDGEPRIASVIIDADTSPELQHAKLANVIAAITDCEAKQ